MSEKLTEWMNIALDYKRDIGELEARCIELEQQRDRLLAALYLWRRLDAVMCNEGLQVAEEQLSQAREATDAAIAKARGEAR